MICYNPLLCLDFYKTCHADQYPAGLTKIVSYYTPRMSRLADTDNLGFTYDQLDQYIMSGTSGDKSIDEKISSLHVRNLHKLKLMPAYGGQP